MSVTEEFLKTKGIKWISKSSKDYPEISKVIDWQRVLEITEETSLNPKQKRVALGELVLRILFNENGEMGIGDFQLFMEKFKISKENLDIFQKEAEFKIKFRYRKLSNRMLTNRTRVFRNENLEYFHKSEVDKKKVEELDKRYQIERVFNDRVETLEDAVNRVNERFKKTVNDISNTDFREVGYECLVLLTEELSQSIFKLNETKER